MKIDIDFKSDPYIELKCEGNNRFPYDDVISLLIENDYNKEKFTIALAEYGLKDVDLENETELFENDAYVQDIVNRIEEGKFIGCFDFKDSKDIIISKIPFDFFIEKAFETKFGLQKDIENFEVYAPIPMKFMEKFENPVLQVEQLLISDGLEKVKYRIDKPVNIELKDTECLEQNKAEDIFSYFEALYMRNDFKDGKATEYSKDVVDYKIKELEVAFYDISEILDFFFSNDISVNIYNRLFYTCCELYDIKDLPEISITINNFSDESDMPLYDMVKKAKNTLDDFGYEENNGKTIELFAKRLKEQFSTNKKKAFIECRDGITEINLSDFMRAYNEKIGRTGPDQNQIKNNNKIVR